MGCIVMSTNLFNFTLRTSIYSGENAAERIPDYYKGLNAKRVVLISDKGLEKAGVVRKIVDIFKAHATDTELVGVFLDTEQDAGSESINRATKYAKEVNADGLLALGGGSVLDTVKGVKFALHNELEDIKEAIDSGRAYFTWPEAKDIPIPHIAVPTTAGTGSEVSPIAVVYNEQRKIKSSIIHPFISADIAVLDPTLTTGLPPFITAFTGFDALTHAIEALASPKANPFSDAYALQTIRLIEENLEEAVKKGANLKARENMLQASTMGITAFFSSLSAVPVHNLAHAYGAMYRIPHGLANAVFLPIFMKEVPELYREKIGQLAQALNLDIAGKTKNAIHADVLEKISALQKEVGLPNDFSAYNISKDDLDVTIKAVQTDPAGRSYPLSAEIIRKIGEQVSGTITSPIN